MPAMSEPLLRYRAGPRALQRVRREGLRPGDVRGVVGPASGPKWLVLPGIDRALLDSGLLDPGLAGSGRILLAGASAGAWRMLTFACRDPRRAHRRLLDGYVGQVFERGVSPATVSAAYRRLLEEVVDDPGAVLEHPLFDLGIHTARLRRGRSRRALVASLVATAAANLGTARATGWFFERVFFHTAPERFAPASGGGFDGRVVRLDRRNLLPAALATGTVPIYLERVVDPPGAPPGSYVDGGLTDYHLRQDYFGDGDDRNDEAGGVVLFPHYTATIHPRWFDGRGPSRPPSPAALADVLQIHPAPAFFARLPDGQLPDREDFKRFVDDPDARIRRWRRVVAEAEALGAELLADLESGRLAERIEPLDPRGGT